VKDFASSASASQSLPGSGSCAQSFIGRPRPDGSNAAARPDSISSDARSDPHHELLPGQSAEHLAADLERRHAHHLALGDGGVGEQLVDCRPVGVGLLHERIVAKRRGRRN
jgi:hypothetical protein